jgi:predicted PurR-regulated permease PerM
MAYERAEAKDQASRVATTALIERSIALLLVLGLLLGVLAILKPFTTAILFGGALAIAAWPLRQALLRHGLGRGLASTLLLLVFVLVVAMPVVILAPGLAVQLGQGGARLQAFLATDPAAPAWLAGLPLAGETLAAAWDRAVRAGGDIRGILAPYSAPLQGIVLGVAGALADSVVQVVLSLIVAATFWTQGDAIAAVLRDVVRRLGGPTADRALVVAAGAVRGVAYGVVGTALVQAALLGIGLFVAGVPGTAMLGFLALLLAISQIGAPLLLAIWGGAAFWLFQQDQHGWAGFVVVVGTVDNVLKPWLIGWGVRMPMALIILGVFGGFLSFGFLGLFIGPALMAVAMTHAAGLAGGRGGAAAGRGMTLPHRRPADRTFPASVLMLAARR